MQAKRPEIIHEFDVFVKRGKDGWKYDGRIAADTQEEAKKLFLKQNREIYASWVTVYPRR